MQDSSDPLAARGTLEKSVEHKPLQVGPQLWFVGHRNPAALLQCNTYVRSFESGSSRVNVCIDPGSQLDYPVIERNIQQLLGDLGELNSFSLNHQDPDVVGNSQFLCEANPNVSVMVTEDVWRLVQHLAIRPKRVHFVNAAQSPSVVIADRHRWQLVPTPFCHFRGAMAFYDPDLRTLFSGDLFGGLNQLGRVQLFAEEQDWPGVAQFHQIYMPSREALRYAVRQIRALNPPVEVIAPQHGHVVTGALVPLFLDRMHDLLVGFDLVALELDDTYLAKYAEVVQRLTVLAAKTMGRDEVLARLQSAGVEDGLERLVSVRDGDVSLLREGYSAVVKVLARLARRESLDFANALRSVVLAACVELAIPIPPIGAGIAEDSPNQAVGPDGIRSTAWWL